MADALVLYGRIHQPLPLLLPGRAIPARASAHEVESCLFDTVAAEEAFGDIIAPAYEPALAAAQSLAEQGLALSVSVSTGFLELARRWAPSLVDLVERFLREPGVETICAEPMESLLFSFDIAEFIRRMTTARESLAERVGRPISAAEVSGFCLNHEIYHALQRVGLKVVLAADGAHADRQHHPGHPAHWGGGPTVLHRLTWLSDELSYRLQGGPPEPDAMADTVAALPGMAALITFNFDDFALGAGGVAHAAAVLRGLAAACWERGVDSVTASTAAAWAEPRAIEEPPPTFTDTAGGSIETLGHDGWWERLLFGRMQQLYQMLCLVPDPDVNEVGHWMLQRANLEVPRWVADEAPRPVTYWRGLWWELDRTHEDTAAQVLAIYDNFIRAATSCVGEGVYR